ncbi:MAG: PEGA domain-containing protein [Polyangiaceae bacterium]|nr:PEGA domain-containing protein [Polyangiaceae bacterium]
MVRAADSPLPATATTPAALGDAQKAEAAERFERGLKLFDSNDNAGALAEFKRTYEIMPNPVVLFNIGLVYAAMRRPVDAVDALEPAIKSGALSPAQLERAQLTLADQKARVGKLMVTTTPPEGARIELDGIAVAKTPLGEPLRISEGSHLVSVVAEGFAPARKEILIAGNSEVTVHLDLVPTQGKRLANVNVRSRTVGAEVVLDGQVVGRTPLSNSISMIAGRHVVEVRRPGYTTARRELDLGEGATGEVNADLEVDTAALTKDGATLVVEASESPIEVRVDGGPQKAYVAPLRLPKGTHHLMITSPGFIPYEREITLVATRTNTLRVVLEPTLETRDQHKSRARFHQVAGWAGVIGGGLLAGGGAALGFTTAPDKDRADRQLADIQAKSANNEPPCDAGFAAEANQPLGMRGSYWCDKSFADAQSKVDSADTRMLIGYIGAGVGGAVAITGVVLLLTGDDPDKYEHRSAATGGKRTRIALTPGPGDVGYALSLAF